MDKIDSEALTAVANLTIGCCTPVAQFEAWQAIFQYLRPKCYLEIGAFKGRSLFLASFLANAYGRHSDSYLFTSLDSWAGGDEHRLEGVDMPGVEACFDAVASHCRFSIAPKSSEFEKIKAFSRQGLLELQARENLYDLIFIDASHRSKDVLSDAILAWPLLREGGLLIFDDYTWTANHAPAGAILESPKLGIDSFLACHADELTLLSQMPLMQLYVLKEVDPTSYASTILPATQKFEELYSVGILNV